MKKYLLTVGIILVFFVVGLSGCFDLVSKEFNGEYEADKNTILKVTNINGKIEINSWDGNTVTLDAEISSNRGNDELEKIQIDVVESNNVIDIQTKYLGTGNCKASTDMIIKVPTFVTVDMVTTSNGDIRVSETKGNITAHSSNGGITIVDVDGYVALSSSNGDIEVKGTTGIADLDTSNGDIRVRIFDFQENINIGTSNGDINVYINPSLNATIDMTTSNGQISISGVSLNLTTDEEERKVGNLGGSGNTITITTSNGDIYLYKLNI